MDKPDRNSSLLPAGTTLYHFNQVPVVARPDFWPAPILLTGLLAWVAGKRNPQRTWLQRLGIGLLAMPLAALADIGHAMAHTVSARLAGAPMDEIFLSSGMPRTLYLDNAVPPRTHILRSLGGPIFSLAGVTLSLLWRRLASPGSLGRDLAEASLAGHGFILLGSVAPVPVVDGGIILKWKLVEGGRTPAQADRVVNQINLRMGGVLLALGAQLGLTRKGRLAGILLAAAGLAGIAAGKGWLK